MNMTMVKVTREQLDALTCDQVTKVYSGRVGCACGCRGTYRYSSKHVASEDRGYPVEANEVNDRQVRKVVEFMKTTEFEVMTDGEPSGHFENWFTCEFENESGTPRVYTLYLTK
jgi:hypothetical protein